MHVKRCGMQYLTRKLAPTRKAVGGEDGLTGFGHQAFIHAAGNRFVV